MQRAFGLDVPQTLEEVCDPRRMALLVYDMQVGVLSQIADGDGLSAGCGGCSRRRAGPGCGWCSCAT
jgi:biuret amidohydrolase